MNLLHFLYELQVISKRVSQNSGTILQSHKRRYLEKVGQLIIHLEAQHLDLEFGYTPICHLWHK